jgi:hypothetical protein
MVGELANTEPLKIRASNDHADHARGQPRRLDDSGGKGAALGHMLLDTTRNGVAY